MGYYKVNLASMMAEVSKCLGPEALGEYDWIELVCGEEYHPFIGDSSSLGFCAYGPGDRTVRGSLECSFESCTVSFHSPWMIPEIAVYSPVDVARQIAGPFGLDLSELRLRRSIDMLCADVRELIDAVAERGISSLDGGRRDVASLLDCARHNMSDMEYE